MKRTFKNIFVIAVVFALLFGFAACSDNLIEKDISSVVSKDGKASLSLSSDLKSTKFLQATNVEAYSEDNLYWSYSATGKTVGGSSATITTTPVKNGKGLGTIKGIDAGTYNFTLYAYSDSNRSQLVYTGSKDVTLVARQESKAQFIMSRIQDGTTKGTVKIGNISLENVASNEHFVLQDVVIGDVHLTSSTNFEGEVPSGYYDNVQILYNWKGESYLAVTGVSVYANMTTTIGGSISNRISSPYKIIYMEDATNVAKFEGTYVSMHTYGTQTVLSTNAVRDYYEFAAWYAEPTLSNQKSFIAPEVAEDVTVYAKWNPKLYSITYDLGSADAVINGTNPTTYTVETPDFTLINPTREGFKFAGWVKNNDTNAVENMTVTKGSHDAVVFTVRWSENKYKVNFYNGATDATDGATSMESKTYTYSSSNKLPKCEFGRKGYKFAGWAYTQGGTVVFLDEAEVSKLVTTDNGSVDLYATWIPSGDTKYTIYYYFEDLNGGYQIDTSKTVVNTTSVGTNVSAAILTVEGFEVVQRQESVHDGVVVADDSLALKVYYARKRFSINWALGTGEKIIGTDYTNGSDVKYGETIKAPAVQKDGYTFNGWNPAVPATVTTNTPDKFEATWVANTYTVHFNVNGGTGSFADQVLTYDAEETLNVMVDEITRPSYKFNGWETEDGLTTYTNGDRRVFNLTTGTDVTLYASWLDDFGIDFDDSTLSTDVQIFWKGKSGQEGFSLKDVDYLSIKKGEAMPTLTGIPNIGTPLQGLVTADDVQLVEGSSWLTNVSGYITDGKWTYKGDSLALYAVWEKGSDVDVNVKSAKTLVSIAWFGQTGDEGDSLESMRCFEISEGDTMPTLANLPSGSFQFIGLETADKVRLFEGTSWKTDVSGYISGGKWTYTGSLLTLYAVWEVGDNEVQPNVALKNTYVTIFWKGLTGVEGQVGMLESQTIVVKAGDSKLPVTLPLAGGTFLYLIDAQGNQVTDNAFNLTKGSSYADTNGLWNCQKSALELYAKWDDTVDIDPTPIPQN